MDMQLDEEHSVHDIAALLKEFLRDMADPLLTKELYTAFINTTCEKLMQLKPFSSAANSKREIHQAQLQCSKDSGRFLNPYQFKKTQTPEKL